MAAKEYPLKIPLIGDSSSYRAAMRSAANDSKAFTNSVNGMSKGLTAINGPLNGVTGRFTALGSLATGTAGKIALVGAAIAASSVVVASSVKEYANYETQQLKVQQLLETTGYAAGLSAKQLENQANSVALATLASVSEIQEAQGVLVSFKSVQEETFTRAIELSQDMAAVFGGTAKDKAMQLGKALESPTDGLNALKRSGVSFTESQKELIQSLDQTGRRAEAQRLILDELQNQIGGAGAAQARGLSGSVDTLSQRWDELQRKWAASSGAAKTVKSWIDALAESFTKLGEEIEPTVDGLTAKLEKLERTVIVGRNKAQKESSLAGRIAALREQILLAKAKEGDMDALNQMIERTNKNISALEERARRSQSSRPSHGQMSRRKFGESSELSGQKQQLIDLIALQTQFNRVKEKSAETQASVNAHQYKVGLGVTPEQAAAGLESVRKAFADQLEVERMAMAARQEMIDAAYDAKQIDADGWQAITEQNFARHQQKITEIQERESKKRADNEARAQKEAFAAYQTTSAQFLEALEGSGKERSVLYKAAFAAQKAAAIPGMIASTEEGATAALKLGPIAGPPAATAIRAMGYASVGLVAGQTIAGVAHGGLGYIPEESTFLLQKGEGVLSPKQNQEVQKMAVDFNAGKAGAGSLVVNLYEDASKAGSVERETGPNEEQIANVFVTNIRNAGSIAQSLEHTYGVQRKGR